MRFGRTVVIALGLFLPTACSLAGTDWSPPPPTRVEVVVDTLHGVPVADPYRWLEDQDSPETRAWIAEQNRYADDLARQFPARDQLRKRFGELLRADRVSIPVERGGRYFFSKRAADQDLFVLYVRRGLDGEDEILVDPHPMDPEHNISVDFEDVSLDGSIMAYSVRQGGADEITVRFIDVATKTPLPDSLELGILFGIAINPGNSGCYYTRHSMEIGSRVYFHRFGAASAADSLVFGDVTDPNYIAGASVSDDGRYLVLSTEYGTSSEKNEVYLADLTGDKKIRPLVNDVEARFDAQTIGDKVYVLTNWKAPKWRLMSADLTNPGIDNWTEIVPESSNPIESFSPVGGKLCVSYLENVASKIKVFDTLGKPLSEVSLPTLGSASSIYGHWSSDEGFYLFTSFHFPSTIYRIDLASGTQSIFARVNIPVDPSRMEVKQEWYQSKDGTRIPMFLVHRKGLVLDGKNPVYLTGYGGFNVSSTPYFSPEAVVWSEYGGVFAVPALRGGAEFGEDWHRAVMFEKKQTTFDDFIAAAEWLIANKYTDSSRLAVEGGSNGGLLVGAFMTQRPDLCRAVVCWHPLLDMLRFHRTMMGPFWVSEYGSADDPAQFQYLRAYSPYHNFKKGTAYPAVMFTTGDGDTRVDPMHARKMTALMQSDLALKNPVLLYYDTKAGHAVAPPTAKRIEDMSFELGFLFWQLHVDVKGPGSR